ncbi:MAG: exo-alpha-sialidase, partial [Bacteroidales bacterium]|nr:exo-alpha-sialidase [Bacteroidales bacterium]
MTPIKISVLLIVISLSSCSKTVSVRFESEQPVYPVLTMKEYNPVLKMQFIKTAPDNYTIEEIKLSLSGTTQEDQIESISLFVGGKKGSFATKQQFGQTVLPSSEVTFKDQLPIDTDTIVMWVSMKLKPSVDLTGMVNATCVSVKTNADRIIIPEGKNPGLRVGVAVRQHMEDNVHTSRIPGLATSRKGTLLAIYDVRRDSGRDLQGNIDIGLNRSFDGGNTWQPMQIVLDRGEWGGLDEKFNGISDACILVDQNSGDIFIAGT